ncbi:MAG: DUF3788 family protein [Polyangiales bacterium]
MESEKVFLDPEKEPTDRTLRSALGPAHDLLARLQTLARAYEQQWSFTKTSGWMLKVSRKKKALFYVIPLRLALKVTLAIREEERRALSRDPTLEHLHDALESARKLPEGYALAFTVTGTDDFAPIEPFLKKLAEVRG